MWCSCHLPDGDPRVSYFSGQATVAVASRGGTAEPPPGSLLRCLPAASLPAASLVPSSAAAGAIAPTRALHCKTREEKKSRTYQTAKCKGGRGKARKGCGYLLPLAHASPPRCRLRNYRLYCCRLGHPTSSRPPSLPARRRGAAGSLPLLRPWSPPCASAVAAGPRPLRPLPAAAAAAGSSLPPIPRRR